VKVRLTAEQVLIAHLRTISKECRITVHVRDGSPTRIACEGSEVPRAARLDLDLERFEDDLTELERELIRLLREVRYGEVPIVVQDGRITRVPAGAMTWTRLTEPVEL